MLQRSCILSACSQPSLAKTYGWETNECIVDHKRRLLMSLNWKAGTRSLIRLIECASGKADVQVHTVRAQQAGAPRFLLRMFTS